MRTAHVMGLALLFGVFFTAEEVFQDLADRHPDHAGSDLFNGLVFWVVWAALTPLVLAAIRRWPPDDKPVSRSLTIHAASALVLSVLHNEITAVFWTLQDLSSLGLQESLRHHVRLGVAFVWGLFTGLIFYSVIILVYAIWRYRGLYAAGQVSAAALEAELNRSKLEMLRSQLRPHFLFNTLNAISVFVTEDAAKARQMLFRLSTLLRRSLDEAGHEVSLAQELGFVNDYLDIQRARFGDRLVVAITTDPAVLQTRVPVFLLQPLLENAIEHGTADDRPTTITLAAGRDPDALRVTLVDDGPGITEGAPVREGIGLGNTRARLHHLYGPGATVTIGAASPGPGTRVEIRIPFPVAAP